MPTSTFKVLAAAGADEFGKNRKTIHRAGAKRKSRYTEGISQPKRQKCNTMTNILLEVKRNEAGKPKLKHSRRRKPVLLRQISSEAKQKIKQAAAIIQRGIQSPNNLAVPHVCIYTRAHIHTQVHKHASMHTFTCYTYVCTNASCTQVDEYTQHVKCQPCHVLYFLTHTQRKKNRTEPRLD